MMKFTKYKETEIGMIPEDWAFEELDKHAKIIMGQSPESDYYNSAGNGTLFLQGIRTFGHLYPKYDTWTTNVTKLAKKGSVLLSVRAPVGEVNFADKDVCIGRGLMSIDGKNNKFIFYLFKAYKNYVTSKETGTVYGSVTRDDISKIKFPFPKDQEQEEIAKILSDLDSKIELNQQMNKTLEAIGQAIFKHWFVDFEFPNEKGKPYKSSGGEMVDSELGKIPKGWKVGKLGDYGAFKNGINYLRNETGDTDFFIANVRDIANNKLLLKETLDKIKIDFKKAKEYLLNEKDILIARSASPGEVSLVLGNLEKVIYSGFSIRYRLNIPENYLYLFIVMQRLKENLLNFSIGTTLQSVNQETLKNMKFILPSDEILKAFNKIIEQILEKTYNNLIQNSNLSQIRDSLLPRLMSGKIRVPVEVRT